jgi:hypothetical protein
MSRVETERELYKVTITVHEVDHAARAASDLAPALSASGLAAQAVEVRSDAKAKEVVIVFSALEARDLPEPTDDQDAVEAEALRDIGLLRKKPAAVVPAVRALLALSRAREASALEPHRQMTIDIEPI